MKDVCCRVEIGRRYPHGNLHGEEGEPIHMEMSSGVIYRLNGIWMEYDPRTKIEKRISFPLL